MSLKVGDVVRYDRIWDRTLETPLWGIVDKQEGGELWVVPVHGHFKGMRYDSWRALSPSSGFRDDPAVIRCTPDPSEWPEEVCVYMAKRGLKASN